MAPHPPHRHSLDQWLRRLDRAADRMNPFLMVLAIGLALLNLSCAALLATHLPITRHPHGLADCQISVDRCADPPPRHSAAHDFTQY